MDFWLPHRDSDREDIQKYGRSFGVCSICSFSGCDYVVSWDKDIFDWCQEMGVRMFSVGEPLPYKLFKVVIADPNHAMLFKLTWL